MKALLCGLIMACLGLSIGSYQNLLTLGEQVANQKPVAIAEQQVVNLPEDGKLYYTTLFLKTDWQKDAKSRELKSWFDTDITLTSLRSQTHFSVVTPADPQWKAKYAKGVGTALPCFALTDAGGNVVYKASGSNITNAKSLASEVKRRCPNRRCPTPDNTTPEPDNTIPDTGPILDSKPPVLDTPPNEDFPLWLGLVLGLVGVAGAVVPDAVKKFKAMG